jgi:hypothetical protein
MKGNAQTFGFDKLALVGKNLETAAQEQNVGTLQSALDEFAQILREYAKS